MVKYRRVKNLAGPRGVRVKRGKEETVTEFKKSAPEPLAMFTKSKTAMGGPEVNRGEDPQSCRGLRKHEAMR